MSDEIHKLVMPKWGMAMTEGHLLSWLVEEGAEVAVGDELAEVETEKLNGAVESTAAGVLRRRVGQVGAVIPVGALIGVIAGAEVPDDAVDAFVARFESEFVPGAEDGAAGPAAETLELAGIPIQFLAQGEGGEPVVLLHGFGGDLENWMFTQPALAAGRAVYALDLPGHGGSGKVVPAGGVDGLADVVEAFLDAQGLDRAHLVGHSLGGAVALTVAARRPERVASLALIAPAGLGPEINMAYIDGFIAARGRRDLKAPLELLFADPGQVTRQLVDGVLRYKRLDGVDAALRELAAAAFPDGRQLLLDTSAVSAPVLVLWGSEDRIIPSAHAQAAPADARVVGIEQAGHSPHLEQAGDVNRALEEFLAAVDAGVRA